MSNRTRLRVRERRIAAGLLAHAALCPIRIRIAARARAPTSIRASRGRRAVAASAAWESWQRRRTALCSPQPQVIRVVELVRLNDLQADHFLATATLQAGH